MQVCKRCRAVLKDGVAMVSTLRGTGDFPGDRVPATLSPGGPGKLVKVLKCPVCGWTVTP